MKTRKRLLAILLCLCMVATLLPTTAFAADGDKTIMLGTSGIKDPTENIDSSGKYYTPNSYIYFGKNGNTPIKWRVLDADKANDGSTAGMFLLSEYLLARGVQFEAAWDSDDGDGQTNPNEWQHSDAQEWCSTIATNTSNFSPTEQGAMLGVEKTDSTENDLYSLSWGESSLTSNDKMFFLSVRELADYVGSYDKAPGMAATFVDDSSGVWWLRSPYHHSYSSAAGAVSGGGGVASDYVVFDRSARPAFNLNLTSVLFTSAAANGKREGLNKIGDYNGNEWKLTLKDSSRHFAVTEATASGKPGDTITLNYTGATTGTNEYISVILADENGALYYGRVAKPDAESGTATLTIPSGLADGSYTLNVFSEQYNGDYKTDYASAFDKVTLTVSSDTTKPTLTPGAITEGAGILATNANTSTAATVYYGGQSWRVIGYNGTGVASSSNSNAVTLITAGNPLQSAFDSTWTSNAYASSTLKTRVEEIANSLSDAEKLAVVKRTLESGSYNDRSTDCVAGEAVLNALLWPLSTAEANSMDKKLRIVDPEHPGWATSYWWLRSPGSSDYRAAVVVGAGSVYDFGLDTSMEYGVRPAFNLNLTSVLFTSAAAKGKQEGLNKIGDYNGNEWKLTLKDSSRNFSISNVVTNNEGTIGFSYSGAQTGENEYISVVIKDNGAITHYGRILQLDGATNGASGIARLTLPEGVTLSETTKLYVFNEQYNGDYKTDYASQLIEISNPVADDPDPTYYYTLTFNTNGGSEMSSIRRAEYTTIDLTDYTPIREGYEFTGWYADEDLMEKITSIRLTRNTTVYAGWEKIEEDPGTGFENPFTDVSESNWFFNNVKFVYQNGLMNGTSDTTFSPYGTTTRAMVATTIWRMEGEPDATGANGFTDVENGKWYTEAITWAAEKDITGGYGNGIFGTNDPVTREQLAGFFYNYAKYKGYDTKVTGYIDRFTDKDDISDWAARAMKWAVGYGLIEGKDNNILDPQGYATRAEFAAMLHRFVEKNDL